MISSYCNDKDTSNHSSSSSSSKLYSRLSVIQQRKRLLLGDDEKKSTTINGNNWLSQLQIKHRSLANKLENQKRQLTTIHNQLVYFDLSNSNWIEQIPSLKETAYNQWEELLTLRRECDELKIRFSNLDKHHHGPFSSSSSSSSSYSSSLSSSSSFSSSSPVSSGVQPPPPPPPPPLPPPPPPPPSEAAATTTTTTTLTTTIVTSSNSLSTIGDNLNNSSSLNITNNGLGDLWSTAETLSTVIDKCSTENVDLCDDGQCFPPTESKVIKKETLEIDSHSPSLLLPLDKLSSFSQVVTPTLITTNSGSFTTLDPGYSTHLTELNRSTPITSSRSGYYSNHDNLKSIMEPDESIKETTTTHGNNLTLWKSNEGNSLSTSFGSNSADNYVKLSTGDIESSREMPVNSGILEVPPNHNSNTNSMAHEGISTANGLANYLQSSSVKPHEQPLHYSYHQEAHPPPPPPSAHLLNQHQYRRHWSPSSMDSTSIGSSMSISLLSTVPGYYHHSNARKSSSSSSSSSSSYFVPVKGTSFGRNGYSLNGWVGSDSSESQTSSENCYEIMNEGFDPCSVPTSASPSSIAGHCSMTNHQRSSEIEINRDNIGSTEGGETLINGTNGDHRITNGTESFCQNFPPSTTPYSCSYLSLAPGSSNIIPKSSSYLNHVNGRSSSSSSSSMSNCSANSSLTFLGRDFISNASHQGSN